MKLLVQVKNSVLKLLKQLLWRVLWFQDSRRGSDRTNSKKIDLLVLSFPFPFSHFSGRVFISLADGHIVVFRRQICRLDTQLPASGPSASREEGHVTSTQQPRNQLSIREELSTSEAAGSWNLAEAVVIRCAPTGQFAVKALAVVASALTLWAAYRNRIIVVDTTTFQRLHTCVVIAGFNFR